MCRLILFMGFILISILTPTLGENGTITCEQYETYTDCLDPCVPTCAIPYERHCEFIICNEGCLCNAGYKKDGFQGSCVPESSCGEYCLPYQEYNECGSACPPTCQNPNPICEEICTPGCFCKDGYIFDTIFELCVSKCVW